MSLKHAVLGFLSYRPMSGYDLKKAFDSSVSHFWPADQSQIYRTLSQLEADGWVDRETVEQAARPDRHVYSITESGTEELQAWLGTPLPPQDDREPFLIQVFFSANRDPQQVLAMLEHQRDQIRVQYAFYEQMFADIQAGTGQAADKQAVFYSMLTLEYVLALGQGYLRWLDSAIDRVQRGDFTPRHPDMYVTGDES
ncbi:MAG: PadR family transcriptional regulator [Chloroflexota bacterium]